MGEELEVKCPNCGHVGTLDHFDVLGAPDDCDLLFCNTCSSWIEVSWPESEVTRG